MDGRTKGLRLGNLGTPVIVLDTNAFWGDVYASRPWLEAVLDEAAQGSFEVVVPETVVRELVKQFPDRLSEANAAVGRAAKEFVRLGIAPPSTTHIDEAGLKRDYERAFRQKFNGPGRRIAADVADLSPAIDWAVSRRAPFKKNGVGFPDAAIWLTVLEVARQTTQVLFVSTNKEDFADKNDASALAPELREDLRLANFPQDRVRLIDSVEALLDEVVTPLATTAARAAQLVSNPVSAERLKAQFTNSLVYTPLPQEHLDLGVDLDINPHPVAIDFADLELLSAHEAGGGGLLLEIRSQTELILDLTIFKGDAYEAVDEDSLISISDPDWNDHYVSAETSITAWLTLRVATNLEGEVQDVEVTDAVRLTDEEIVRWRLDHGDRESLLDLVREPAREREIQIENYLPPIALDSDVDQALVVSSIPESVELISVDERHRDRFVCTLSVKALCDVRWVVSAPSGHDAEEYSGLAEVPADEGGWLSDVESETLLLRVGATLTFGGEWVDIEIEAASLRREDEEKRRHLLHPEQERWMHEMVARTDADEVSEED